MRTRATTPAQSSSGRRKERSFRVKSPTAVSPPKPRIVMTAALATVALPPAPSTLNT